MSKIEVRLTDSTLVDMVQILLVLRNLETNLVAPQFEPIVSSLL